MATTYKTLLADDITPVRSKLHEAIPVTGSIISGTYGNNVELQDNPQNWKFYSHDMFVSVYDYPYLSSSANHIFDITVGYSNNSALSSSSNTQNKDKINMYNQMAQVLVGYDKTGSIQLFDEDGDITAGGAKLTECMFLSFSRLLVKDEIKKGSFQLELAASASYTADIFGERIKITDYGAATSYKVNSPAGEYGILYVSNSAGTPLDGITTPTQQPCGLLYYQAGVAVLNSAILIC